MANVGDKVIYHPGTNDRPFCDATVTKVNDDGTVNIEYPHPLAPDVLATADCCQWGTGLYQVSVPAPEAAPEAPAAAAPDLASMTRAELDAHAAALGIDTTDAKTKAEAMDRIATVPAEVAPEG